ncbi:unnamed protein product [Bubo scandiacus]
MDHEVDGAAQVLLQRMGDSSKFIQKAADQSLDIMVKSVTPARAMTALTANGAQHRNVLVRRCAAKHLLTAMEQIGAEKLLSGARDRTEVLVCTVVRLAQDCHPDTRSYGRKMLTILMSHKNFDRYLKQSVPSRDLEDVMARLKRKGGEDHKCELPSVKAPRKSRKSSLMTAQHILPSNERLRDCNKKVNQQALEVLALMIPMLKDALHPVLFSLVSAVIDNLNSKHSGIYAAAVKALEAAIAHLDNRLMLQAFAHRVRFLSGQALLDVTEHLSGLTNGSDPGGVTLKPLVSMSASQRFLATSKPLPPIQNGLPPSELGSMSNGEQEHGESGTGCDDSDGDNKKLTSEAKGSEVRKASQITCLTNGSDPGGVTLKPLVSMSASQRFLATSKPLPPIQNGLPPSELGSMSNGEQEHGESGTGCDDSDGDNKKLTSEAKGSEASLLPLYCNGGDRKKSLGLALIPPIPKTAKPSDEAPGRSAVPPPSSPHLVFQKALEMRPRSGSRIEEKTVKFQELQTLEPIMPVLQHRVDGGLKSSGHLCETVLPPLRGPPLRQIKEVDHLMNPSLLSDDDLKYSNGRIRVTLSKSVQKKIDQKRMRQMEILRREREKEREKEKSLQLPTRSVDPGDTAKESFGSPPVNGTDFMSPSTSSAHRERAGTALRKRVDGPPLPSIPVISQGDSFPRKSSANSLLANDLDFLEQGDESECGDTWEARPVPNPQQELLKALTGLSSDDW